jgi:hypothetical protein
MLKELKNYKLLTNTLQSLGQKWWLELGLLIENFLNPC